MYSSSDIFASESFNNKQYDVDKFVEKDDFTQSNKEQIQPTTNKSLIKPILVLAFGLGAIVSSIFLMKGLTLHQYNKTCREHHHHRPGVHCKVELFNMGFGGCKMSNPDDCD